MKPGSLTMTNETFQKLMDKFADKYGVTIGDAKRGKYRNVTYDIPDEDADALYEDVCKRFDKLPDTAQWRIICSDYRESTRIFENKTRCFACNDDGYVFWSEHHESRSAFCPLCLKGQSLKRHFAVGGVCEHDIAEAVRQRNAYQAEKDDAKRRAMITEHVIYMATHFNKEREIEI